MGRNANEQLTFILNSINEVAAIHDQDELLVSLAKMGRDIVSAQRCSIWIWDQREHKIWTKVAQGIAPVIINDNEGLVGSVIQSGKTLIVNNVQDDKRFKADIDEKTGFTTRSMIIIPMFNNENSVMGAIQVINKNKFAEFKESDIRHLTLVSTYVAENIKSMIAKKEIQETQKELIHILGITSESRSNETATHVARVTEYSWLLAKLYGLTSKECELLRSASPMHDIGKVGIPDNILKKPSNLTENEMQIMQEHTVIGHDILKYSKLSIIQAAAIIAYQHHEKYDGSGYPRGLKGEDIHIFGRITALVDVFDALSSERVYKGVWEDKKIISFMQEESGKHFDPRLIEVFLSHFDHFIEIRQRLGNA